MANKITLGQGNNWHCYQNNIDEQSSFINCEIKGPSDQNPWPVFETRPGHCEILFKGHDDAMGSCRYIETGGMKRCGCPTLDPNKNPVLWNHYRESVSKAIISKVNQDEITLTLFGSGHFLGDFHLLDHLFSQEPLRSWHGTLNLQFVDLEYKVQPSAPAGPTDAEKKAVAIACAVLGCISFYAGAKQKEKKHSYILYTVGAATWIIAILALISSNDNPKIKMQKDEYTQAAHSFLDNLSKKTPCKTNISFFSSNLDCIKAGKTSDVIFGYDIGNGLQHFNQLRKDCINFDVKSIVVIKEKDPNDDRFEIPFCITGTSTFFPYDVKTPFERVQIKS